MNKIAAILMVSVIAMAVLIPAATADELESLVLSSLSGVMDETGTWLLGDGTPPCDLIQIINVTDGIIDPPDPTKPDYIGGNDVLLDLTCAGESYPFNPDEGKFYRLVQGCAFQGDYFICRAWNAPTIEEATHYGDSPLWQAPFDTINPEHDYGTWSTDTTKPGSAGESKLVSMSVGWNAISLCFEPSSNATADVMSSIAGKYDAVKEWDASLDTWADASTMDRGTGYFVHVTTTPCQWNHTGQNETDPMVIELETDLNFVGYPFNKVNMTSDALAGLDYYYAAPFDASTQKYEDTYNPAAPAPFNDFTTINPCVGFWVSSNDGGDWTAS